MTPTPPNLVEAAKAIVHWRSMDWEEVADLFYRETGYMRPGKDDARHCHSLEERQGEWNNWTNKRSEAVTDDLRQALAALPSDAVVVSRAVLDGSASMIAGLRGWIAEELKMIRARGYSEPSALKVIEMADAMTAKLREVCG